MIFNSKYSIEIVDPAGNLLADLTGRAKNRTVSMSRNNAEDIQWEIDLNEFEAFCRTNNRDPRTILVNGSSEVRIKRLGTYLCGGQLSYFITKLDTNNAIIQIRAQGFLNLFADRYTTLGRTFTATDASTIAATLINESQALTNGNYGITIGSLTTVGNHDRIYNRATIKQELLNLTTVQTAPLDFEFTYNKVFNTYAQIGSDRPEIIFEYPKNIKNISIPNDATNLANEVIALGAGIGTDASNQVTVDNTSAAISYRLRQKIMTPNGVSSLTELTDQANAELNTWSFPIELPTFMVDGNLAPFITDYKIGDRVRLKIGRHKFLEHITGLYRIEKIDLAIDDNDNENVTLYVSV